MAIEDIQLRLVQSWRDVEDLRTWLGNRRDFLAVDIETSGLNKGRDRIRLVQFGDHTAGWALSYEDWKGVAREVIHEYDRPMVAHNLLFDSTFLKRDGIVIPQHFAHDTMVMSFLMNAAARMDLKGAAAFYVDKRAQAGKNILAQAFTGGGWEWGTIPTDHPAYWWYSALDTCLTSLLASALWDKTGGGPFRQAYELELAVIHCIREAELAGMATDPAYRELAKQKLQWELDALRPQIPITNPGSDRQVIDYLHGLGAIWNVYTEKGNLSVDKHVLAMLAPQFPVATVISQWRNRSRMLSNYLLKMDHLAVDDIVYASTRPLAARTGRQSVTDPPLQTLPRGRVVRDAFIPREGCAFVLADFKGMEMRALASLAQEQTMLAAFDRGEDLHDFVARTLYGEGFTKPERTVCKNAGFAKVYGAGVEKFAATAGIPIGVAQSFLAQYDETFPGVGVFMQRVSAEVMQTAGGNRSNFGYVTLFDGRRLPVEGSKPYKGVNFTIQGGCAVSVKEKIVELDAAGIGEFFRLSVHDELIFEVPIEYAIEIRSVIKRVMPDSRNWGGVVLEVDTDVVDRWGRHYDEDYPVYVETEVPEWLASLRG